ncbi:unnamed protein product [Brassica oleracea var. botrytis]
MASKSTPGVIRHERRLVRYYLFTTGSSSAVKEEMKKEWRLISTTWEDFANGVMVMFSLVRVLRRKDWS